ncbi:MAG: hypothetical protein CMJ46_01800 [Planctomyces sp.]|nr:hypothetical protein [Planctomyces sp.]
MSGLLFDDLTIQKLFGHEAAEDEDIESLREYYFKGTVFQRATEPLPLRIIVGHKGIGKSALFAVAKQEDTEFSFPSLLLRPDDVYEISTTANDMLSSIKSWKDGLLRIIFDRVVTYLSVNNEKADKPTLHLKGMQLLDSLSQVLQPMLAKFADTDSGKRALVANLLEKKVVRVYLDDLDRGWNASGESISRLAALLNALRDLSKEHKGLQFRISLRSDVYYLVRTSDESADKYEGSVVWYRWTNHEILAMLVKRVLTYFGEESDETQLVRTKQNILAQKLDKVFAPQFLGVGKWSQIPMYRMLMSLIRKRPRDLVKLCTLAAQNAAERSSSIISTHHFKGIFDEYSQGRLQDTVNEYRSELPNLEALLLNMRPTKRQFQNGNLFTFTTADLLNKIRNIQQNVVLQNHAGKMMSERELLALMYKINFITARKKVGEEIDRHYFDEKRYLSSTFTDYGYDWEVHPAYRWALNPIGGREMFDTLNSPLIFPLLVQFFN